MKIHTLYINRAIALIDLAIDGLNRIKELIASNKEITDNDWMRSAAPLNELSNLINIQLVYCRTLPEPKMGLNIISINKHLTL